VYGGVRAPIVVLGLLLERLGTLGFGMLKLLPGGSNQQPHEPHRPNIERATTTLESIGSLIAWSIGARARDAFDRIQCPVLVLHGALDRQVPVGWT
jgi:fermentation-respiration switch protein FrsA (DUF1100 family)